jgi:membrane dipeptidase
LEQVDGIKRIIEKYPNTFQQVYNSQGIIKFLRIKFEFFKFTLLKKKEILDAFKNKKVASLIGLESGHAIDSSLAILRVFYNLGVRYMTLTHNCDVPWATNNLVDRFANASSYGGLTKFGRTVIQEMNRLGMIVDISHVSYQTQLDVLEESKAPVMFSHSSVFALCNHSRNVRDDVLLKLVRIFFS